jgi:hemerythrin-like domain-containing protein
VKIVDELREEHVLIEKVVGSLVAYAVARLTGEGDPADGARFVRFFRLFSGEFHHGREEEVLIPALVKDAEIRADSGPVVSLLLQHREMEKVLARMVPLLEGPPGGPGSVPGSRELHDLATSYARSLWLHVDAENTVLLPESEERLRRSGVHELAGPEPTDEVRAARAEGERLVAAYPPRHDPGAVRGEGCAVCPSHGVTCEGVEREWWTDWEWEAFGRGAE